MWGKTSIGLLESNRVIPAHTGSGSQTATVMTLPVVTTKDTSVIAVRGHYAMSTWFRVSTSVQSDHTGSYSTVIHNTASGQYNHRAAYIDHRGITFGSIFSAYPTAPLSSFKYLALFKPGIAGSFNIRLRTYRTASGILYQEDLPFAITFLPYFNDTSLGNNRIFGTMLEAREILVQ